jgi:hypothetical protein
MKSDPRKVETMANWPLPQAAYDVRAFLGLADYFRCYIQGYAATALPLTDSLKGLDKQAKMRRGRLSEAKVKEMQDAFAPQWTPGCQQAFETLKHTSVTASMLALPHFKKPFQLVCNACDAAPAVGAELMQGGRPLACYSRKLTGAEANYSATDLEILAA